MKEIEQIDKRLEELKKSLIGLQNNANAHIGAIQELEKLKDLFSTENKEVIAES